MFEVNVFTPGTLNPEPTHLIGVLNRSAQFGAFIPWLTINRGPLSAMIHPNTGDEYRDHTQRATWMGTPWPVNLRLFQEALKKRNAKE